MNRQTKVAGVILAGGLARRMGGKDKGLLLYNGQPMIAYAINAMAQVVEQLAINANRNLEQYREFGYPVINDLTGSFDGPLAGVLAAMTQLDTEILLTLPCDTPLIEAGHLQTLLTRFIETDAQVVAGFDGSRMQPTMLAVSTGLRGSLQSYLSEGGRKVETWLNRHSLQLADFSREPGIFANINTPDELSARQRESMAAAGAITEKPD
ncbi:MAG: molybdenum cofactor guanylyltransferase [Methylobacter sp.]|nr:MAG: molybdenum cofactor guanylyltransferase [Methylobacter sp.]